MSEILSAQQITVLDALASGASVTQAATEAGIHRNTIANWRRESLTFQAALTNAQYERAFAFREKAEEMTDLAFDTLRALLTDPKASPSVRLRAALTVVKIVTAQMPPQKKLPVAAADLLLVPDPPPAKPENLHNAAQSAQSEPIQTIRRDHPKTGRNDACPCGSGQKFKRCCIDKPSTQAASQAAREF